MSPRAAVAENINVAEIALGAIILRQHIDDAVIDEMTASIKVHGLLQPIVVRPHAPTDDHPLPYEVVAGHVRFVAAKRVGLTEIPCVVKQLDELAGLETALVENLLRNDLAPLDEAQAIARYKQQSGLSVRKVADRLSKGRGWVQERLELDALPQDLKDLVSLRPDAASHACEINKVTDAEIRKRLIDLVAETGMSLVDLRKKIKSDLTATGNAESEKPTVTAAEPDGISVASVTPAKEVHAGGVATPLVAGSVHADGEEPATADVGQVEAPSQDLDCTFAEVQCTMRYLLSIRPPADKSVRKRLHQDLYEMMEILMNLLARIEEYGDES